MTIGRFTVKVDRCLRSPQPKKIKFFNQMSDSREVNDILLLRSLSFTFDLQVFEKIRVYLFIYQFKITGSIRGSPLSKQTSLILSYETIRGVRLYTSLVKPVFCSFSYYNVLLNIRLGSTSTVFLVLIIYVPTREKKGSLADFDYIRELIDL